MPEIQKLPVHSSNIEAIGYDQKTNTLRIWFANGNVYDYDKVSATIFDAFKNSVSVGSHFAYNIKGIYSFIKIN